MPKSYFTSNNECLLQTVLTIQPLLLIAGRIFQEGILTVID